MYGYMYMQTKESNIVKSFVVQVWQSLPIILTFLGQSRAIDKSYWYRINAPHRIAFYNQVRGHGTFEA